MTPMLSVLASSRPLCATKCVFSSHYLEKLECLWTYMMVMIVVVVVMTVMMMVVEDVTKETHR